MIKLSSNNFDQEVLEADVPVFVDFLATWCGPCKALTPLLEEFATENADKMKLCSVDVDDNVELATKFSISAVPQIMIFKNGTNIRTIVGLKSKKEYQDALDEL